MDGQRFDAITRALASAKTRRHVLGALLASAAASVLPRRAAAEGAYCGVTCVDSGENCDGATDGCYTCCDPLCVDLTLDPNNCGDCGVVCPGGSYAGCINAACYLNCPDGWTNCGQYCADVANDIQNCLACGNVCNATDVCCPAGCSSPQFDDGNCGACGNACPAGQRCCNAECVDSDSDVRYCGSCDVSCAADQVCRRGACAARCPAGQLFCDPDCIDPQNDSANCGACGAVCAGNDRCQGGACVSICADGTTDCGGKCVDLTSDQNNCGACGVVCDSATSCANGICIRPECPSGQTRCQDGCFDTTTDANHCGGCTNVCIDGLTCCAGACFDLKTDPKHCGRCDFACPPGYRCDGKGCILETSGTGTIGSHRTASPDLCVAKARTGAELSALIGAAPTPAPAPSWRAIAKGAGVKAKRASATLTSTISDAVVQVSACGSANDPARQTALMSDAMASDWFTARGYTSDLLAGAVQTTPAQLPPQSWDAFASIDHIYTLGRDRASARVAFAPLSPALEPRVETHIFVKETSGWKLDAIRSLDAATASAKSGSLLARIFDCPAGVSADDPSANCEPTPELTFDYEIASADGSVRKSAADANFIGAGLLLWKNLPPGRYRIRAITPAIPGLSVVTSGGRSTAVGETEILLTADAQPAHADIFHQRTALTEATLRLRGDADCPPCSHKDFLRQICIPACPPCSNCRSVRRADGVLISSCQTMCRDDQACAINSIPGDPHEQEAQCCNPVGGVCSSWRDCCEFSCQNGVCTNPQIGDPCPSTSACGVGAECSGDTPNGGVCVACKTVGDTCADDTECCDKSCFNGVCKCCSGGVPDQEGLGNHHICCVYPQALLIVNKSSQGPAFGRCCLPGVDCIDDPYGPPFAGITDWEETTPILCRT